MKSRWLGGKETLTRADHRVYALREPAPNEIERQNIRVEAETGDDSRRDRRDHTRVAELLASVRVREMHLNEDESCRRDELGGVAQRIRVMSECRGVQDDRTAVIYGGVQPGNQRRFVIRLAHIDGEPGRCSRFESGAKVIEIAAAINVWLTAAQSSEVGSVEYENSGHAFECIDSGADSGVT